MWARHLELVLGMWLWISPLVFGRGDAGAGWWRHDLACGSAIVLLALFSYWRPLRDAHWFELLVALWLVGFGWATAFFDAPTPASQNHLLTGLVVGMLAIVPNEASLPPAPWRSDPSR